MKIKTIIAGAALGVAAVLGVGACTTAIPEVTGTIDSKYIEDWSEHTIVLKQDGTGTLYHFEVEDDQWQAVKVGDRFSSTQLQTPTEDD